VSIYNPFIHPLQASRIVHVTAKYQILKHHDSEHREYRYAVKMIAARGQLTGAYLVIHGEKGGIAGHEAAENTVMKPNNNLNAIRSQVACERILGVSVATV